MTPLSAPATLHHSEQTKEETPTPRHESLGGLPPVEIVPGPAEGDTTAASCANSAAAPASNNSSADNRNRRASLPSDTSLVRFTSADEFIVACPSDRTFASVLLGGGLVRSNYERYWAKGNCTHVAIVAVALVTAALAVSEQLIITTCPSPFTLKLGSGWTPVHLTVNTSVVLSVGCDNLESCLLPV